MEKRRKYSKLHCPHCNKEVSKSSWYNHYDQYYDKSSCTWQTEGEEFSKSSSNFDFGSSSEESGGNNDLSYGPVGEDFEFFDIECTPNVRVVVVFVGDCGVCSGSQLSKRPYSKGFHGTPLSIHCRVVFIWSVPWPGPCIMYSVDVMLWPIGFFLLQFIVVKPPSAYAPDMYAYNMHAAILGWLLMSI